MYNEVKWTTAWKLISYSKAYALSIEYNIIIIIWIMPLIIMHLEG